MATNTGRAHPVPPSQWNCAVCHRDMHVNDKDAHLAGKFHQDAVRRPMVRGSTTKKKARSKRGGLKREPTREDEITREDALSLLHDVDTAFGLCPGGGAYKESNHYYGPGIYDYY